MVRHLRSDARLWPSLVYALVVLGCLWRTLRWLDDPALWLDESFLAINLVEKPFADLFGALQFLQTAPPGFLAVEKGAEALFGDSERSLRLLPLLASLSSVPLFAYSARRVLGPPAAAFAVALFAANPALLERAAEVKPYPVDVFVATLLVALCVWTLRAQPESVRQRVLVLGGVGVIVLWLSFPAVFMLAGAFAALLVRGWQLGSRRVVVLATSVSGVLLLTFGAVYLIVSSGTSRVRASVFGDDPHVGRLGVIRDSWNLFEYPTGFYYRTAALAALLLSLGLVALARWRTLHYLALLGLPLVAAFAAAVLHRYPIGGRFSFFLVPAVLLAVGYGAQAIVTSSRHPTAIAVSVAVLTLSAPLGLATGDTFSPPARDDIEPALRHLVREWRPGDALYVYTNTQYALRYYSECEDCSPSGAVFPWPMRLAPPSPPEVQWAPALESVPPKVIIGSGGIGEPGGPRQDFRRLPPSGRIWLLFTNVIAHDGLNDENLLLSQLRRSARMLEELRTRGAQLYLFDRAASG